MPEKKSFYQFGLRSLLLLVVLAAFGAWIARNEMVREQRREELIAEFEATGAQWVHFFPTSPPPLWREPIAAFLRGKPMVAPRSGAMFGKGISCEQLREFLDLFPSTQLVEIDGEDAKTEVLELLASRGPFGSIAFKNPLSINKDTARRIAQIKCNGAVSFSNQEFSDADLKNLADAGVKSQFSYSDEFWRNVSDEGLKAVAKSPLNDAVFASCPGTDEGVRALARHPSLELLSLTGPNYTDASADVIPTLPRLKHLWFMGTSHTDAGLAKAVADCNASNFSFENVTFGDKTIAALAKVSQLEDLTLRDVDLTLEQCDALAKLFLVGELTIHGKSLSDDHIARLAPLAASLSGFELKAPRVTDAGLAWLNQAKGLETLYLYDTQASVATWSSLSYLTSLEGIGMGGPNLNAEMLACTSNLKSVTQFGLAGTEVNDATLEHLPGGVYGLLLVDTQVTLDGLKKLARKKDVGAIDVFHYSDARSLITPADVKEAQAAAGPSVIIKYDEVSKYRCD